MVQPETDCSIWNSNPGDTPVACDENGVSRASIALNNIGVSLLARGAYRLSLKTFHDSIAVLSEDFSTDHRTVSHGTTNRSNELLEIAQKRLASTFSKGPPPLVPMESPCVAPISCDGSVFHGLSFKVGISDGYTEYHPAWIECSNSDVSGDGDDLPLGSNTFEAEFHSALIFYNFAVAHLCLAQEASESNGSARVRYLVTRLQVKVLQILDVVHEILDSIHESSGWSFLQDESRLALAALSQICKVSIAKKCSAFSEQRESSKFLSAADAWHCWSIATSELFDGSTSVVLGGDIGSYLSLRQHAKKAPAA
jgi:hypothetical protein